MELKKLYITAGHNIANGTGTGAFGVTEANGKRFDEAVEARKLVDAIIKHQKKWYGGEVLTDIDSDSLSYVIAKQVLFMEKNPDAICIDIHFNAGPESATGHEVFIPQAYSPTELFLADKMVKGLHKAMGLKIRSGVLLEKKGVRGVKLENETQHNTIGILRKPYRLTNMLVEICFITNPKDVEAYRKNLPKVIQYISDVAGNFRTGVYNDEIC